MYVCMGRCARHSTHVEEVRQLLEAKIFSFDHVGSGDQTQVPYPEVKRFYPTKLSRHPFFLKGWVINILECVCGACGFFSRPLMNP